MDFKRVGEGEILRKGGRLWAFVFPGVDIWLGVWNDIRDSMV